jgi:membrane protein required for beta-lactamase induction
MTLLALLVALWAVKESHVPSYFAECQWGMAYLNKAQSLSFLNNAHPALGYGFYIIPPVLVAWYFSQVHDRWFFSFIEAVAAVIVFVACLDYRKVEASLIPFLKRWRNREWQAAYEHGSHSFDYGRMVSPGELINQTTTQYWVRVNQTLFAPLFWFAIFGLSGLVLYVFTTLLIREDGGGNESSQLAWKKIGREFLYALDGVPARAIALTIAVLCFNGKVVAVALRRFRATDREAEVVLKLAVKMGLDFQELPLDEEGIASEGARRLHAVQDLRSNVFVFWLVVLAVLTIIA